MDYIRVTRPRATVSLYASFVKGVLDIVFSLFLLFFLLPLFLFLAVILYIDSPGCIFFRQTRIGKNGKEFTIYKFRTMHTHAPAEGFSPTSDLDPRITRFGRFLRKTSLDELPQLLNILRGEMSFVGPRPEQKKIVEELYTIREKQRFLVKPGMTGLWQISQDRNKPIHENLQHDLLYLEQMSFLMDLSILFRTIRVVMRSNTC